MYSTRIYYQDTDAGGVVYFANYLKFMEKSWFEYLLSIGISLPEREKMGTYLIVRSVALELIGSLRYSDMIEVTSSVTEVRGAYFILSHTITRDGKVTTRCTTKMVSLNNEGKPKRIPDDIRNILIEEIQKR
jgi:acyl-CoA thioester hydrolase